MLSDQLLKNLPPFSNKEKVLIQDQNVDDIIDAIVKAQKKYQKDYYNIYTYFVGSDEIDTACNVWNFLKHNVDYVIEPDTQQTIKSPAAILSTSKKRFGGNDCKNFALFTAGCLSAYRDNELKDFDLYFRFAAYDFFDRIPQHVFVVMKINNKEIWIDPVLDKFNEHRQPTYFIDKKINQMALVALSGVWNSNNTNDPMYTDFGSVTGTVSDFNRIGFTIPFVGVDSKDAVNIVNDLTKLFANKPSPVDWKGWDALDSQIGAPTGTNCLQWVILDGDSVQNEALNIVAYIKAKGTQNLLGYSSWFKRDITISDIADKLRRGGFPNEAKALLNSGYVDQVSSGSNTYSPGTSAPGSNQPATKAGMNIWITVALAGAAIFAISKMKK